MILAVLSFFSCNSNKNERLLIEAREKLSSQVGEMDQILKRVARPESLPDSLKAEYAYMKAAARFVLDSDPVKADSLNQFSLDYYAGTNKLSRFWNSIHLEGEIHLLLNQPDSTIYWASKGLDLYKKQPDKNYPIYFFYQIIQAFRDKNDPEQALFYAYELLNKQDNDRLKLHAYSTLASIYEQLSRGDSAIYYYNEALEITETDLFVSARFITNLRNGIINQFIVQKEYKNALDIATKSVQERTQRRDIAVFNLAKARVYIHADQPDSARFYLKRALQSAEDKELAVIAYQNLWQLNYSDGRMEEAYYDFLNYENVFNYQESLVNRDITTAKYKEALLENENNQLKIAKQTREIYLLCFVFIFLVFLAGLLFFFFREKKKKELREKEHQNLLLKQENELSSLREKTAVLRESLFRKMSVSEKIPSLDTNPANSIHPNARIRLEQKDWEELIYTINQLFPDFTLRLKKAYPALIDSDVEFCCLIKIKVSLRDMADIYCISKAGITKRKTRMKKEKLFIQDETTSLDDFLFAF